MRAELLLQMARARLVRLDQIAGAREQVGEVERAGRRLQRLIARRRAGELLLKARGEVGVGILLELLQIGEQRVARGEHVGPRRRPCRTCSRCPSACARSRGRARDRPAALPSRRDRAGRTTARAGSDGSAAGRASVSMIEVVARRRRGCAVRSREIDAARATRRSISAPRSNGGRRHGARKVAPLGQRAAGAAQPIDRTVAVAAAAETPAALVRRSARRRPSGGSCSASCSQARNARVVQAVRLRLGEHREQRIDARFDRPLAQQLGAEAVDGVDVRFLERLERVLEPLPHVASSAASRALAARALRAAAASARPPPFR